MCYKTEVQKKNEEILNRKLDELQLPLYMRKYFTIKIESKAGAINYLGIIVNLLNWFIEKRLIVRNTISGIQPSDFDNIMAEDITLYLRTKEQEGIALTTLETRKNVIRSFWNYMSRIKGVNISDRFFDDVTYKGIISNNNLIEKLPSDDQLREMERKIMRKKDVPVRNRNIAIFNVLKGSGIRETELAGLDISDLHLDEDMPYFTILGKGKYREQERRTVYLTGNAKKTLIEWLEYRSTLKNIIDKDAVFVNKNGTRTTENNIKKIFKTYGDGVSAHMLRHYYASIVASKGNLIFSQQQLGHSSVRTTMKTYANGSVGMKTILETM